MSRGGGRGNARPHQRGDRDPSLGPTPVNPPRLYQCVRNVTLPAGVDAWARSAEGKRTVVNAAIGVGDVSFFAGMIKLHGDYLDEVDRAVRDEKKTRARPRDGSARRSIHPPRPIRRRRRKYLSYLVAN